MSDFNDQRDKNFPGNIQETQLFITVELGLSSGNAWPVITVVNAGSQEIREQGDRCSLLRPSISTGHVPIMSTAPEGVVPFVVQYDLY